MFEKTNFKFLILLSIFQIIKSSKILIISQQPYEHHQKIAKSLAEDLIERNHFVTLFTIDKIENLSNKIQHFNFGNSLIIESDVKFRKSKMNWLQKFQYLTNLHSKLTENHLKDSRIQKIIKQEEKFDILIIDCVICALLIIADVQKIPAIYLSPTEPLNFFHDFFGNTVNPALHPDTQIFPYKHGNLNFPQRFNSFFASQYFKFIGEFQHCRKIEKLTGVKCQQLYEHLSFMFIYTHHKFGYFRPLVPNVIQIGFTYVEKSKYNEKIQNFLDNSVHGVIFMDIKDLDFETSQIFFNIFINLSYNFIWQIKNVTKFHSRNILIIDETQAHKSTILSHKSIKLFITSGDLIDIETAVYYNVPSLIIPLARDQFVTAHNMEELKIALQIDFDDINEKYLIGKIEFLINNLGEFKENCKKLKEIAMMKKRRKEVAAWHVEYVIRRNGAKHLRYPGRDVPYWQKQFYDIYLFFSVIIFIIIKIKKIFKSLKMKRKEMKEKKNQ
ncbi:hypothetical protein PVAND_015901 [Polypedilum vanderplanki]|uniref:Glucuronosyltransferase n=1 Tax=Polypedilum vanderplanki TaxID=319348 RepID=A0A9J6BEA5_POLVA|nr:hypothetical protein PVAND_015901 [Polypedilum vanderplanki]